MLKELEKRLISSIILILITFLVVLEGKTFFYIFLFIAFLISSYEWSKMIKRDDIKILGILFLFFSFYRPKSRGIFVNYSNLCFYRYRWLCFWKFIQRTKVK